MPGFFDFNRKAIGPEFARNEILASSVRPRKGKQRIITAAGTSSGFSGMNYAGSTSRNSPSVQRYNPVQENLAEELLFQTWLPRDLPSIHQLFRDIHQYDAIAGSAVDLISTLPWSDFNLVGIEDRKVMQVYEESVVNLDIRNAMAEMTTEFLVIGQIVYSLLFDNRRGVWTDMLPQDIDACRITPIPIHGYEPKIDVKLGSEFKKFLSSPDPRDKEAVQAIPEDFLKKLSTGGWIELEPLNTLFLGRKTNPLDLGTSFLARTLPFYAIEKALIDGTLLESRRRQRAILHIQAGIEEMWEPTPEEMDSIASMFIQADEDPHGAVVVTRTGIEANEIRAGGEFWKLGDEWTFLSEAKMRALGINEAFLSGEAVYNTMEVALSVFVETLRNLREVLTYRIFERNIFPVLARAHGFVQRSQAELDHRIRVAKTDKHGRVRNYPSMRESMRLKETQLILPKIHWAKQLKPEADEPYLEVLSKMEEKGIPIPLRTWAAAGGINLETQMKMMDEDAKIRKQIADWKASSGTGVKEGEAWGGVDELIWGANKKFLGLKKREYREVLRAVRKNGKDPKAIIAKTLGENEDKIEAACYVLKRTGLLPEYTPKSETLKKVANHINKIAEAKNDKILNRKVAYEYMAMGQMMNPKHGRGNPYENIAKMNQFDGIPNTSRSLFSGV